MNEAIYHIIVIGCAAYAVVNGFRLAFTRQVSSVLGFAFGIVCAQILGDGLAEYLRDFIPGMKTREGSFFASSVLGSSLIYVTVYYFFKCLTKILRSATSVFEAGMLDSIFGAAFSLVNWMLGVSIFLNLLICVNPRTSLMKHVDTGDGNVVGTVIMLAPSLLGCVSSEDLHHQLQLRDARRISHNITNQNDVIDMYCMEVSTAMR